MAKIYKPLSLTLLSQMEVARKHQASTEDVPNFREYLSLERAQELYLYIYAAQECSNNIQRVQGGHDLLTSLLSSVVKNAHRILDTRLLSKLVIDYQDHVSANELAMCVRDMRSLDFQSLRLLIKRCDDFVILNNLFLLAVYEADFYFMDLCIERGADDFDTAQKIATFNMNANVIHYLVRAKVEGPPSNFCTSLEKSIEYFFYYELMRTYSSSDDTRRHARYSIMTALGNSLIHASATPDLLDRPMSQWPHSSLFNNIVALSVDELYDMSFASLFTPDFSTNPYDPIFSDDNSEYDEDEGLVEFFHWYMSL